MLTHVGVWLSAAIGVGIILIGVRFLLQPLGAAAGFGIPEAMGHAACRDWLYVKGVRDIASGLFIFLLVHNGVPHLLGWFMLLATFIPLGDGAIVLRSGGPRSAAYGIHGATAAVMLLIAGLLIAGQP